MKKFLFPLFLIFALSLQAQVQVPAPSPFSRIEQKVGLTDVTIEYSRPNMRGREIFGDLIPYDETWRTGANSNTKITFSDDISIQGKTVAKGTYAIYTIPQKDFWTVMLYSDANNWGVPQEWDKSKVVVTAKADIMEMPMKMETFTIVIDELKADGATLNFMWDQTVAMLEFSVPTEKKAMASIDKIMNGPTANDYFAAASYYHDSGKDLEKAHSWVTKATEMAGDDAYWMLRKKSLIEADLGNTDAAIESAKRSLAAAKKAGNKDYIKMNEDSLKEWQG